MAWPRTCGQKAQDFYLRSHNALFNKRKNITVDCTAGSAGRFRVYEVLWVIENLKDAEFGCVWLITFATTYFQHRDTHYFTTNTSVKLFYTIGICMASANLVLLTAIAHYSLKGSLVNVWPRRYVRNLLEWKMGFGFLCFFYVVPSTYWAFFVEHPHGTPDDEPLMNMRSAVLNLWFAVSISAFTWRKALYYPLKRALQTHLKNKFNVNFESNLNLRSAAKKAWYHRIRTFGKILHLRSHPEIKQVGILLSDFFKGDDNADVTTTDVVAGLILLHREQTHQRPQFLHPEHPLSFPDKMKPLQPWMTIENCYHYSRYGAGIYGWPYYVMESPVSVWGLAKIIMRSRCPDEESFIPHKSPSNVVGDGPLQLNTTVIKLVIGLHDSDLFFVSYHNNLFEIPFAVAIDHRTKAVVVAIRGTLSLEDIFIDLVAFESEEIPVPGFTEIRVHQGILLTAQNIRRKLLGLNEDNIKVEEGLLEGAWRRLEADMGSETARQYNLVITGQSLGGGAAAVLALLLRQEPKYRDILQCFAYSPPGGLMRLPASRYCENFTLSIVMGDDIVARLSLHSVNEFRIQVLNLLRDCDLPKHKIVGGWLRTSINRVFGDSPQRSSVSEEQKSWLENSDATRLVQAYQNELTNFIDTCTAKRRGRKRLYPPGIMLHIHEHAKQRLFPVYSYSHAFLPCDAETFSEIPLTTNMIRHHKPYLVMKALKKMCNGQ
ncbi:hypothetical protein CAPTEDRAFT_229024 [Capitella teleta]|uniref:sn-1-specific diacylglycerol lipase n=1 Tax=Capitella teleta TaxID=283909 RepID=R7UP19_CAPTE|nr:hypothetical protein CAPTEDRAFT_229024 [Capitella teleta]|eukprot:ELU05677.1 hypothetical protein CAPTEDRAFT_229024 [Capitella teleta]